MEQNKLENEFRKQLNSREIQPSENAWEKLDAMLVVAEDKKTKPRFLWIYIAASLVGILLVSTVFFKDFDIVKVNKPAPIVLEEKADQNVSEEKKENHKKNLVHQIQKKQFHNDLTDNDKQNKQPILLNNKKVALIINQGKETTVGSSEKKNDQLVSTYKYVSAEKLLADVSDVKFEPKRTDETQQRTRESISVDPNDLLSGAETELNQSYRESALDRLSNKFNTIKTVFVNRNYEE